MSIEQSNQPVQLSLDDLLFVLQAIQLASSRGAYKPEEFTTVGSCYERVYAFLAANGAVNNSESPVTADQTQGK